MSNGGEPGGTGSPSRWQADVGERVHEGEVHTRWVEETRRYRRPIGGWWWLALFLVPAILALMGSAFGGSDDKKASSTGSSSSSTSGSASGTGTGGSSTSSGTSGSVPTSSVTLASAPFAVTRGSDGVTVSADVPDATAGQALVKAVKEALPDATVIDKTSVVPGASAPDARAVGASVAALSSVKDFGIGYDRKGLTIVGTAADDNAKKAAVEALTKAWPAGANPAVVLGVGTDAAASCPVLGDWIRVEVARATTVTFPNGGAAVPADLKAALDTIAPKVKGCPGTKLAVTGYTDKTGTDSGNQALSKQRAQAVADYLASLGVDKQSMVVTGKGSADPIVDKDVAPVNRRVEITVVK